MSGKEERLRELDKLMIRVSTVFLAIVLGFAPTWIDRMEDIIGGELAYYSIVIVCSPSIDLGCGAKPRNRPFHQPWCQEKGEVFEIHQNLY